MIYVAIPPFGLILLGEEWRRRRVRVRADPRDSQSFIGMLLASTIWSTLHIVAVPTDADEAPVRKFNGFTGDLHQLTEWLKRVLYALRKRSFIHPTNSKHKLPIAPNRSWEHFGWHS